MLKKIALTGPESSGKTTLCLALASHFQCRFVPEMARLILEKDGPAYDEKKVEEMARIQIQEEIRLEKLARESEEQFLFCDTNLLVYQVWMEVRFGRCPSWIVESVAQADYALQLLMYPDLPWEADPLRENPLDRLPLFHRYESILKKNTGAWVCIQGDKRFEEGRKLMEDLH